MKETMQEKVARTAAAALLLLSGAVFALPVPVETVGGLTLRIEGFDPLPPQNAADPRSWSNLGAPVRDASAPLSIAFAVSNGTSNAVSGKFTAWMNDDWTVDGVPNEEIAVAAGASLRVHCMASAGRRVLPALYPIHALFESGPTRLHVVAVFRAKTDNRAFDLRRDFPDGESFALDAGAARRLPTKAEWNVRAAVAQAKAKAAIADGTDSADGRYRLELNGDVYGVGVAYGEVGLVDGVIAFTDGGKTIDLKGFTCEVDGRPLHCLDSSALSRIKTRAWAEKGTFKVAWSMPGVTRDGKGTPRFTKLVAGSCDTALERVYVGMGNVIERPDGFTMRSHGQYCSTRHIGADYANGFSLVQASDVFPDELTCNATNGTFALVVHNDATLSFTPSRRGAFDAAIRFAAVSGYRKSPGFDALAERIVLDDWRGDYARAARGLPLSRKYGIDAVYLQHKWQRWGYDVRLPEVWPPMGDRKAFDAMCKAARDSGTILGLHDNYIDLYPDAPGFTYDDVYYTADGLPHVAWYNPGLRIMSYKWRPDAIWGWYSRNMKAMALEAGAGALFLDVFTAASPKDWYDRSGRFHTQTEQAACWSEAFDRARTIFGRPDAIMVSEAGHDALIGHVDAGQADHYTASFVLPKARFADAERVPWHDAVSHGKMILLGGGLAVRYSGAFAKVPGADIERHGYASKDYLCTTVIGGRGAMCDEAFSRKGVETWWLLGDVLKMLARSDFRSFSFGRDIHEQHSVFSCGEVWVNRSTNRCWNVEGRVLPPYGLYVRAGGCEAGIVKKGNADARFAKSPRKWFVDARPPSREMLDFGGIATDGAFRLELGDDVFALTPLPSSLPFSARIDLVALGAAGRKVSAVEPVEPTEGAMRPHWRQDGDAVSLDVDAKAFAYRLKFLDAPDAVERKGCGKEQRK